MARRWSLISRLIYRAIKVGRRSAQVDEIDTNERAIIAGRDPNSGPKFGQLFRQTI